MVDLQKMPILAKKIIFADEANFDLGGYVNKQNLHIWGTETTHAYIEKPTHPKRVTVWYGFSSRGIIGPFFFENEQGEAVTDNGDRYRAMLNEFLFTKIDEEDIGNIWFRQDSSSTCHTAEATLDVLRRVVEDCISWCRLTISELPFDTVWLLFVGCRQRYVSYADKPETNDALKNNIHEAIDEIQLLTIINVLKNWTNRVCYCMASWGCHC